MFRICLTSIFYMSPRKVYIILSPCFSSMLRVPYTKWVLRFGIVLYFYTRLKKQQSIKVSNNVIYTPEWITKGGFKRGRSPGNSSPRQRFVPSEFLDLIECNSRITRMFNLSTWLWFGTLIGSQRGRLSPWDHDVDCGALSKERYRLVEAMEHVNVLCQDINRHTFIRRFTNKSKLPSIKLDLKTKSGKFTLDYWYFNEPNPKTKLIKMWGKWHVDDLFPLRPCTARIDTLGSRDRVVQAQCPNHPKKVLEQRYPGWNFTVPYTTWNDTLGSWI